ncbi:MAG: hypothetical protein IJE89_03665 [Bacilli bacterium]|nr:hypothetical protein [Bacilli bacterium]
MKDRKYKVVSGERKIESDNQSAWKLISYFGILALICVISFLIAKYVVRNDIDGEESPIDTSERL